MAAPEADAVVSIASNSISIVESITSTVEQTVTSHKAGKPIPRGYQHLLIVLPLLQLTLDKTHKLASRAGISEATCRNLKPSAEQCRSRLKELLALFIEMQSTGKVKGFFKPSSSTAKEARLLNLANELMKNHVDLVRSGAVGPSPPELAALRNQVQFKMDDNLESMVHQLQMQTMPSPSSPANSHGASSPTASTSSCSPPNNILANDYYNLSNSQIVGILITEQGRAARAVGGRVPSRQTLNEAISSPWESSLSLDQNEQRKRQHFSAPNPGIAAVQFERALSGSMLDFGAQDPNRRPDESRSDEGSNDPSEPTSAVSRLSGHTESRESRHSGVGGVSGVTLTNHLGPSYRYMNAERPFNVPSTGPAMDPLASAVDDIRFAASNAVSLPSAAKQAYLHAIKTLDAFCATSSAEQVRRMRNLSAAELGLSLVAQPADPHIAKAWAWNESAYKAALAADAAHASGNLRHNSEHGSVQRWRSRVLLDRAQILARKARLREKAKASAAEQRGLRWEAFEVFHSVVSSLRSKCSSTEDDDVLAQALVGCGRMARKVGANKDAGLPNTSAKDVNRIAHEYWREARSVVERGMERPEAEEEEIGARDKVLETAKEVEDLLGEKIEDKGRRASVPVPKRSNTTTTRPFDEVEGMLGRTEEEAEAVAVATAETVAAAEQLRLRPQRTEQTPAQRASLGVPSPLPSPLPSPPAPSARNLSPAPPPAATAAPPLPPLPPTPPSASPYSTSQNSRPPVLRRALYPGGPEVEVDEGQARIQASQNRASMPEEPLRQSQQGPLSSPLSSARQGNPPWQLYNPVSAKGTAPMQNSTRSSSGGFGWSTPAPLPNPSVPGHVELSGIKDPSELGGAEHGAAIMEMSGVQEPGELDSTRELAELGGGGSGEGGGLDAKGQASAPKRQLSRHNKTREEQGGDPNASEIDGQMIGPYFEMAVPRVAVELPAANENDAYEMAATVRGPPSNTYERA